MGIHHMEAALVQQRHFALPAMECGGVEAMFNEGDRAFVDFDEGTVTNVGTGKSLPARKIPPQRLEIVNAGGIFALLEREGSIAPRALAP